MKEIVSTETVYSPTGDGHIIAVKYWYADGTHTEKKVFIPPKTKKSST